MHRLTVHNKYPPSSQQLPPTLHAILALYFLTFASTNLATFSTAPKLLPAMSAASTPIPAARFAAALESLSLSSLYTKVSELQNSIAHLEASNAELEEYARKEDDKDCYDALMENEEVIGRMMARIELVKREVIEVRGLPWMTEDGEGAKKREVGERRPDGGIEGPVAASNGDARARTNGTARPVGNGSDAEAGDDGVFL